MKKFSLILFLLAVLSLSHAEGWKLASDLSFTLTQNQYSDNWAGSELSNVTWVANSNSSAEKQMAKWLNNKTTLKLAFGQTHLQKRDIAGDVTWDHPTKSTDKIDLESLSKFTLQAWVDPYLSLRAESQFIDESDATLTRIVNPILLTESAGVMKTLWKKERDELSLRLGAAFREKLDREVLQLSGDREMVTTVDGGAEFVSEFKHIFLLMDANFKSKFWAYQAVFNSKSDELNDDWKTVDFVWENVLTAKLWKIVSGSLTFEMRYDKEQQTQVQWKQILGLGVSYSLF